MNCQFIRKLFIEINSFALKFKKEDENLIQEKKKTLFLPKSFGKQCKLAISLGLRNLIDFLSI